MRRLQYGNTNVHALFSAPKFIPYYMTKSLGCDSIEIRFVDLEILQYMFFLIQYPLGMNV